MNGQPKNELLQRVRDGDREAFGQLHESIGDQVYRTV
jgi:hypothetical protein